MGDGDVVPHTPLALISLFIFETWKILLLCCEWLFLNFYFIQKEALSMAAQLTLVAALHIKLNRSQEPT